MIVVNLFGSPGAGKSTIAAGIFYKLKVAGYNVELVTEYAKDMVYEEHKSIFIQQDYLFAKQHRRLSRLTDKVDIVVTDSPLLLQLYYAPDNTFKSFKPFVSEVFNSFNNVNFFIERDCEYQTAGRFQTAEESDAISIALHDILKREEVKYNTLLGNGSAIDILINLLKPHLDTTPNAK